MNLLKTALALTLFYSCLEGEVARNAAEFSGAQPLASEICSGSTVNGVLGIAVCSGVATSLDAQASFISGNYSNVINLPSASEIAAGSTILGVSGDSNVVNTVLGNAIAGDLIAGKIAFVDGVQVTGTLISQGNWDMETSFPGSGVYASVSNAPLATEICSGKNVNGVSGSAICSGSGAIANNKSLMFRDMGTTQLDQETELSTGVTLPAGYREVPDILKDDDGLTGESVTIAIRPSNPCGETQATVDARVAHCLTENPIAATWDGEVNSNGGESVWRLVTFTAANGEEVWQDTNTGLLWSDNIATSLNWCRASGSSQVNDPDNYCNSGAYQDQTSPYSACVQFSGAQAVAADEDYLTNTYAEAKGGMGAVASTGSPEVHWRLPTRSDLMRAEANGIRFVLPNFTSVFWSATIVSSNRSSAWDFRGSNGNVGSDDRSNNGAVRCVGR